MTLLTSLCLLICLIPYQQSLNLALSWLFSDTSGRFSQRRMNCSRDEIIALVKYQIATNLDCCGVAQLLSLKNT